MNVLKLSKYKSIYIVSPHFDDAALSCGSLILKLGPKANIIVVNIFTKAHKGPYTLSAKKFLKDSGGYRDATVLFNVRQQEDKQALLSTKVKIINLAFQDSLFRRKSHVSVLGKILPEIDHIYPTYRWHILKSATGNDPAAEELRQKLAMFSSKDAVILAPYGIGGHIDHRITRSVCEDLFTNLILYSDFPYNARAGDYGEAPKDYKRVVQKVDLSKKERLLKNYKTQFQGLFGGGKMPSHKEVFFLKVKK